jgi:alpha-tubulin suppressor-like RCC1 family protein
MSLVPASGLTDFVAVTDGWDHSLAIDRAGRMRAWGRGDTGQLGGRHAGADTAVVDTVGQVVGLDDVVAVAAGAEHSAALRRDGTIWEWGSIGMGERYSRGATETCGAGDQPCATSPVQVRDLAGVVAITSGLALVAAEAAPSAAPSSPTPGMPTTGGGAWASTSHGGWVRWTWLAVATL